MKHLVASMNLIMSFFWDVSCLCCVCKHVQNDESKECLCLSVNLNLLNYFDKRMKTKDVATKCYNSMQSLKNIFKKNLWNRETENL